MHRLALNSIVLTTGSYFSAGASLLTYLIAARQLGPAMFGSLSGAIGIATLMSGLADFGINGWAIRALAQNPASIDAFRSTLTAKLAIAATLAVAWVGLSLGILQRSPLTLPVALLAVYLLSLVVSGTLAVPFRASENMAAVSLIGVVEKAVALGLSVLLVERNSYRPEVLSIALAGGGIASVASAAVLIPRRFLSITTPSLRTIANLWRSSYGFGLVGASAQILRADVAVVAVFAGSYAAGVYAAPSRLTTFLAVIPAAFSAALFPRLARSSGHRNPRRPEVISAAAMVALMLLLLGIFAIAAPLVVPAVLGSAYLSSVDVFRIYLLVILVNAANQPLLTLLQADGDERYAGFTVAAAVGIGLMAIALGSHLGGAEGAAVGALLIQLIQLVLFARRAVLLGKPTLSNHAMPDASDASRSRVNR